MASAIMLPRTMQPMLLALALALHAHDRARASRLHSTELQHDVGQQAATTGFGCAMARKANARLRIRLFTTVSRAVLQDVA